MSGQRLEISDLRDSLLFRLGAAAFQEGHQAGPGELG